MYKIVGPTSQVTNLLSILNVAVLKTQSVFFLRPTGIFSLLSTLLRRRSSSS